MNLGVQIIKKFRQLRTHCITLPPFVDIESYTLVKGCGYSWCLSSPITYGQGVGLPVLKVHTFVFQVGPQNPFKTKQQLAPKNMLSGYVEPAHFDHFQFENQRRTFHSFGKKPYG